MHFLCAYCDSRHLRYYLRQVNEVNGANNAFVRCVSACLSVYVCAAAGQWELNANSSKTVKATDLKFDILFPRDSPDVTPKIFFSNGGVAGSHDPLNFWALNANNSKTVKATDLKFDKCSQNVNTYKCHIVIFGNNVEKIMYNY